MFSSNVVPFNRKPRIDFRDHRRRDLRGLGQETAAEASWVELPASVYAAYAAQTRPSLQPSLLQSATNLFTQYLTLQQLRTQAQTGAVRAMAPTVSIQPPVVARPTIAGFPIGYLFLGGALLATGYFIFSGRSESKGRKR